MHRVVKCWIKILIIVWESSNCSPVDPGPNPINKFPAQKLTQCRNWRIKSVTWPILASLIGQFQQSVKFNAGNLLNGSGPGFRAYMTNQHSKTLLGTGAYFVLEFWHQKLSFKINTLHIARRTKTTMQLRTKITMRIAARSFVLFDIWWRKCKWSFSEPRSWSKTWSWLKTDLFSPM